MKRKINRFSCEVWKKNFANTLWHEHDSVTSTQLVVNSSSCSKNSNPVCSLIYCWCNIFENRCHTRLEKYDMNVVLRWKLMGRFKWVSGSRHRFREFFTSNVCCSKCVLSLAQKELSFSTNRSSMKNITVISVENVVAFCEIWPMDPTSNSYFDRLETFVGCETVFFWKFRLQLGFPIIFRS